MTSSRLTTLWNFFRDVLSAARRDKLNRLSAALAFFTLLSLAPLFTISVGVASFFLDRDALRAALGEVLGNLMGDAGRELTQLLFENAFLAERLGSGLWPSLVGTLLLLFFASNVLSELHSALNSIWRQREGEGSSLWHSVWGRLISLTMVLALGFVLVVSLVISTALAAFSRFLSDWLGVPLVLVGATDVVLNLVLLTFFFALLYKFLPDVRLWWRDIWPGAALTAVVFVIGKWIIGIFLGNSILASAYGAAGSLVIFLLWVFFTAQMFFFGAEVVKVYTLRYGSRKKT
ncbi:MAG: YihY/virulence factor BrkB family protein [Trueperaceae bacterium]|nr:YihY/virulence factor BrkB family protein [Trueperaceae bacterium]